MKVFLIAGISLTLVLLTGCSAQSEQTATSAPPSMVVYKSPTCGCCADWVEHLEEHGFTVTLVEENDLSPRKRELGVPHRMASCHTGVINGYVIEGHVPAGDIQRLLAEQPDATGLAVPGMPIGSPGMEMGERRDPYTVWLFAAGRQPQAFARHGEARQ